MPSTDVLMITYNRPSYTRLALERLLETCDASMRVWIWQNGTDRETLEVVRELARHERVHRFHESPRNVKLREPTNWLWSEARGDFVSKVDDDCLVPREWGRVLPEAHGANPEFGVIGCWRFLDEDFVPELARPKIREFRGGHSLLQNFWVEGSGYLMKRACVERQGMLRPGESFPQYCIRLALSGWVNGWYHPFLHQEHMDDPRSPHSMLRSDADVQRWAPLSAQQRGVTSLDAWQAQLRRSARLVQEASIDARDYRGARVVARRLRARLRSLIGG